MSSIIRGHSYDLTDIVTAQTLNDLVRLATISGLTVSDLLNSSAQISVFSAASGAANGWLSAQYDPTFVASNASFSEFNYVLTTPAGQVALFKPYGLETRRFQVNDASYAPGSALLIKDQSGSPAVTLRASGGYTTGYPQHQFLGANYSTHASGGFQRIVLKGTFDGRVVDAAGAAVRHYWYLLNAVTSQWQHSAGVTNTNKVAALSLDHRLDGDTVIPGFLFGSPLWRA